MMKFKVGFIEVELAVTTKKARIRKDLLEHGRITATKNYQKRYKCSMREALEYVRKVAAKTESEER
jgi:ribosomal protein L16/L10AE